VDTARGASEAVVPGFEAFERLERVDPSGLERSGSDRSPRERSVLDRSALAASVVDRSSLEVSELERSLLAASVLELSVLVPLRAAAFVWLLA
jgi:hypothetical protein